MRIALLGALDVRGDDDQPIAVNGAKMRALLAVLALHAGRPVSVDHLVDALWGADPPPGVKNGLQGLVSKLRRSLGSTDTVAMRGGGYALEVAPDDVDVHRVDHLVTAARAAAVAGDRAGAVERLGEAAALWRGDALAEFAYEEFAGPEITRLAELRLSLLEERLDLELGLGRHQPVVSVLDPLVAAHPLRERLRGLLMLALYRSGRQADALRVYQEGRRVLAEELGLDPGPELRDLEAAILAHDPSIAAPHAESPTAGPAAAATAVPHRWSVPAALTPLVGREPELAELSVLVGGHRFVTLVGPGGVGKTRLALEVARDCAANLADGACLVELAPVGDPAGVRAAIAAALALPDPQRLTELVGAREVLIVLDNCEHVVNEAAVVAEDLLRHCPALRILATSREGLRAAGETIWPVPPLGVDDAVELFVARARAAGTALTVSDETAAAISEICVRLDGLPLAVELAAARTRAFSIPQIAARLHDRFRVLTGGVRTALPRQQTLRAVVDWSYELLFDDEQRVFERLGVFPGGCDLATAEAVCADDTLPADELGDIIQALVDKSLVIATPAGDGIRYRQLQTLAQYGREKLAERGDAERIRDAMAAHFTALCAHSATAYVGDDQGAWLATFDRELDNVRAALEWAVANDDADRALTIAGGAAWRHWLAGTAVEGRRWLDLAFACSGTASDRARAAGLTGRGILGFQLGERASVDADLTAAMAVFREHGDADSLAMAYSFYSEVAAARGEIDEARRRRREQLDFLATQPEDPFVLAARAYSQAKLAVLDRDLVEGERRYREAEAGFARIERPMMRSMCLDMVADFEERAGRYGTAAEHLATAVGLNEGLGLLGLNGSLLSRLGWARLQHGDLAGAAAAYARSLDIGRHLHHLPVTAMALTGRAVLERLQGHGPAAAAAAGEALHLFDTAGPRGFTNRIDPQRDVFTAVMACCAVLSGVAAEQGDVVEAARLLDRADRLGAEAGVTTPSFLVDDLARTRARVLA